MISKLHIQNYKSLNDVQLEVGRFNVFIGENGCGKSNLLEAITFAGAAAADKLDNEFLAPRGIRVTEPQLMRSAFDGAMHDKDISIHIRFTNQLMEQFTLKNDNKPYEKWIRTEACILEYVDIWKRNCEIEKEFEKILKLINESDLTKEQLNKAGITEIISARSNEMAGLKDRILNGLSGYYENSREYLENHEDIAKNYNEANGFIIYSPENTSLRNLEKEAQIQPLGIYGEGLFKLLTVIQSEAEQSQDFSELNDIQETLELFGWFESIKIPNNHLQLEQKLTLKDRYLALPFDQRSANEGFLLVLFYITLVVSKYTPKIFAIDNIDTSLNPKLCTKLIKELVRLAKKYDKQVFVTSHNPAILDGIDLSDDEQRLFVVSRNNEGHTCFDRLNFTDKPKSSTKARLLKLFKDEPEICKKIEQSFNNSEEPVKLSEAFLRGYLGGLPTGF